MINLWSQPPFSQQHLLNFIAGPLGLRDSATGREIQRTKARVWLTPNTCFFPTYLFHKNFNNEL